jgi:serine/threonine protein kinase
MAEERTAAQLVEELRAEQRGCWLRGERVGVEVYLAQHPALQADTDGAVKLIYHEVLLREERGEAPQLDEYLQRFPQWADRLRPLFEVHQAVASGHLLDPQSTGPPRSRPIRCPHCHQRFAWTTAGPAPPAGPLALASSPLPSEQIPRPPPAAGTAGDQVPQAPPGYELLSELGRGGMAVVYRARDLRLEREVAVKLLSERYPADSDAAVRFRAEAQITGQLQHPGIPAVHELGTLPDGRPFLAMKLVKGRTLHELLAERPNPAHERGRFLAIFEQVCQAVGYAHAHRVIHRDLKPSNVMVGAHGEVQVMDWGLAKVLADPTVPAATAACDLLETVAPLTQIETPETAGSATRTGMVLGTPAYMAPEQAGGEIHKLDARSDVFGLGAILCQILTGQPPYRGVEANEVRLQAVRGELADAFARLEGCEAADLVALCQRCLAVPPAERPADGGAVAQEVARLRQAAEERARQAERERAAALVRAAEQGKRRRVVLLSAGAVAAVLLGGIALSSWQAYRATQAAGAERRGQGGSGGAAAASRGGCRGGSCGAAADAAGAQHPDR